MQLLDKMLIVPLGLLLIEQIRFGSCCGNEGKAETSAAVDVSEPPDVPTEEPVDLGVPADFEEIIILIGSIRQQFGRLL